MLQLTRDGHRERKKNPGVKILGDYCLKEMHPDKKKNGIQVKNRNTTTLCSTFAILCWTFDKSVIDDDERTPVFSVKQQKGKHF